MRFWRWFFSRKLKTRHFELGWTHILYGRGEGRPDSSFIYFFYWWNWLDPDIRYWGLEQDWYDHPINHMGFWFFNWAWFSPWTRRKGR